MLHGSCKRQEKEVGGDREGGGEEVNKKYPPGVCVNVVFHISPASLRVSDTGKEEAGLFTRNRKSDG